MSVIMKDIMLNPWWRTHREDKLAYWEVKDDLCDLVKPEPPFHKYRRLLDLIEMHIFDFVMGNMDRHHYETYKYFGNNTFQLHYDNGREFGKTKHDEISILAPLYQCCHISYSTVSRTRKTERFNTWITRQRLVSSNFDRTTRVCPR
jgi:hypothetical protein